MFFYLAGNAEARYENVSAEDVRNVADVMSGSIEYARSGLQFDEKPTHLISEFGMYDDPVFCIFICTLFSLKKNVTLLSAGKYNRQSKYHVVTVLFLWKSILYIIYIHG